MEGQSKTSFVDRLRAYMNGDIRIKRIDVAAVGITASLMVLLGISAENQLRGPKQSDVVTNNPKCVAFKLPENLSASFILSGGNVSEPTGKIEVNKDGLKVDGSAKNASGEFNYMPFPSVEKYTGTFKINGSYVEICR